MSILGSEWQQSIVNSIDEFGCTITLRAVSKAYDTTSYRSVTDTNTDTANLKAFVQILTTSDDLVKEGIFRAGDMIFWFKGAQASLTPGNKIYHNSIYYEINDVIEHEIGDTIYVIECRTKKV